MVDSTNPIHKFHIKIRLKYCISIISQLYPLDSNEKANKDQLKDQGKSSLRSAGLIQEMHKFDQM